MGYCWVVIFYDGNTSSICTGNEELENKHECTTYIKYQEHYQITPMTWYYRDSFKCIECGKDWKD